MSHLHQIPIELEQFSHIINTQNRVYIYTLSDPINRQPLYVGQTRRPTERLEQHIAASCSESYRVFKLHNWIYRLQQEGRRPYITFLEVCSLEDGYKREQYWYDFYQNNLCYKLYNRQSPIYQPRFSKLRDKPIQKPDSRRGPRLKWEVVLPVRQA